MAKTKYFLELLLCFRAYQKMKVNITREMLERHGVQLPRGGITNKEAMTRDLFIHLTHDRATLEKTGGMKSARDWAKNRMKGAKVAQRISDTVVIGKAWELYSNAAQNPQDLLPDLRLFHLTGDNIDNKRHLSTGFSLVGVLQCNQDGDVVNTPQEFRPQNKFGPDRAAELADARRAH
ncbi:MAG: hypothetical protein M1823_000828 [Watsoniomyces obsoletus]|nr:MAG: hypothetical protein M1823_000828 [Watsoniomyces obsoletus]